MSIPHPYLPTPKSYLEGIGWPSMPNPQSAQLLALQYQLEASQWLAPEEIGKRQMGQLGRLIHYARAHSPFWHRHLPPEACHVATPGDLLALPVLDRGQLQRHFLEICTTNLPPGHGKITESYTSGSTGQPVKVRNTNHCGLMWHAFTLREHLWHCRDFQAVQAIIRADITGKAAKVETVHPVWGPAINLIFPSGPTHSMPITMDVERQLDWLLAINPVYLLTYPSNLDELLNRMVRRGAFPTRLRQIRTISETLSPSLRQRCQELLGVGIADLYSSQEAGIMAFQCPEGSYHIQSEGVLLEVLDEVGKPCPPGVAGRVVVTDLHNFATPLIRYELRDYAEAGPPCPCGRGLPVLSRILGRSRNMLRLPDGRCHWPVVGFVKFREIAPAILRFQLVQTTLENIEARFMVEADISPQQEGQLLEVMRQALGYPFAITFHYQREELPRSRGGKFEEFRSELA